MFHRRTKAGTSALTLLVRKIPDVMRFLVDRLDTAVTIHDHDPGDPDCEIRLDFRLQLILSTIYIVRSPPNNKMVN